MSRSTCRATNADGEPCESPVVGPDGYCPAHRPDGGSEHMSELGKRGAESTANKLRSDGIDPDELPDLDSPSAAETWCDVVGRAVVVGRIGHNEAKAALRAVREWRESHETGQLSDRLGALEEALAEWRETGDPTPVLEVID